MSNANVWRKSATGSGFPPGIVVTACQTMVASYVPGLSAARTGLEISGRHEMLPASVTPGHARLRVIDPRRCLARKGAERQSGAPAAAWLSRLRAWPQRQDRTSRRAGG